MRRSDSAEVRTALSLGAQQLANGIFRNQPPSRAELESAIDRVVRGPVAAQLGRACRDDGGGSTASRETVEVLF